MRERVYIVCFEEEDVYHMREDKVRTFDNEQDVTHFVSTFVKNLRLQRIFSIDHYGNNVQNHEVVFEGQLKLKVVHEKVTNQFDI